MNIEQNEDQIEADAQPDEIVSVETSVDDNGGETPKIAEKEWTAEDEEEARAFGWKSSDEWQGDKPPGYIEDPRTYTERLDNFKPFAKLKERLDRQEFEYAETNRKLAAMNQRALEEQRKKYESQMQSITNAQRAAVEVGDTEEFDRLEAQRATVSQSLPHEQPGPDPYAANYAASPEGAWLSNPVLKQTAAQIIDGNPDILAQNPEAQIKYAEAEIRKMYPAYFPKAETKKPVPAPQRVDAGGLSGGTKSNAFAGIPADAKAAFARYVEEGLYENTESGKKAYADEYNAA